ncbi:zinc finger protein 616-like [Penaeus japonicus]|uniref:zinc finger protein 616-like n=1 Tax=Penaeus japonicus TaxID=27405 RepID=UPI001C716912|nr:zinc finger protein 616-like [Penaeus japonicus]XP_042890399.1 zinc finger protein 616-like [Penaeus japonicus]
MKEEDKEAGSSLLDYEIIKEETFLFEESDCFYYGGGNNLNFKTEISTDEDDEESNKAQNTEHNKNDPEKNEKTTLDKRSRETDVRTRSSLTCKMCCKKFRRAGNLRKHSLVCEGGGPFICRLCGKEVANQENLDRHVEELHMIGVKRFVCNDCGRKFSRKGNLKSHMVVHTKTKRDNHFVCHKCDEEFDDRSTLMRHVRGHDGQECRECGMRFSRERLSIHMAMHMREKYSKKRSTTKGKSQKCLREITEEEVRRNSRTVSKKKKKGKKSGELANKINKIRSNPLSVMWDVFNSE